MHHLQLFFTIQVLIYGVGILFKNVLHSNSAHKLYPLIYSYACSAVYNLVQPSSLPTVMLVETATEPLVTMYDDDEELVLDVQ